LNNIKTKIGIICPLDDEYNACKEILDLKNESELSGKKKKLWFYDFIK
jgi:hypothetical protein